MYLMAVCDDEAEELKKAEELLYAYRRIHLKAEFMVKYFENADDLLEEIREETYVPDLIWMDIYMPCKTGIEAARELRAMGNRGRIVFLTTSREHALEAFRVEAAQYLVKPIYEKDLFPILDKFLAEIEEERQRYLILRVDGRSRRVAMSDMVYYEAHGKMQYLHLADGTQILLRMTMAEIFGMLSQYQEFVRVGISYIVNLEHIESLSGQDICFQSGKKIYLPRGAYKALKEQYFQYYCEG